MRKRKIYSKEFKEEAIRLVKENGLTCIQVERDLNGLRDAPKIISFYFSDI